MSDNSDSEVRGRGFLTKDDRQYLLGEKESPLKDSARRQKHLKIRNRLENALHDFQIVEQKLPEKDIEQVFEPIYEWGRERRKLNEEGRYSAIPGSREQIRSLVSLFNFLGYSMALSRMGEVAALRDEMIEEGLERGLRKYSLHQGGDYLDYNVNLEVTISHREAMQNHLVKIDRSVPERPDEAAQEILRLYHQNRIPRNFAKQLWDYYVE